jgi:methylated-DNA-protein-cysteine methyltransferase related protein
MTDKTRLFEIVHSLVRSIPPGKVASYGQIARLAGAPGGARTVGWAMHGVSDPDDVPWHRVVNARGQVSLREGAGAELQRALLEDEGVEFGIHGRIDLKRYGWDGPDWSESPHIIDAEEDTT